MVRRERAIAFAGLVYLRKKKAVVQQAVLHDCRQAIVGRPLPHAIGIHSLILGTIGGRQHATRRRPSGHLKAAIRRAIVDLHSSSL